MNDMTGQTNDGATPPDTTLPELVAAAVGGSGAAWTALVARFAPLVAAITHRYHLTSSDADDVAQTVWLRLVEHLKDLRQPRALPGWIRTTTRNEALRVLSAGSRVEAVDPQTDGRLETINDDDVATNLLLAERRHAVGAGLAELQDPLRELLLLIFADPPISQRQISLRLGIPTGSIGPTRARTLRKLKNTIPLRALAS
jgi:RNA polymerase sigma factor (sigma-70 family)